MEQIQKGKELLEKYYELISYLFWGVMSTIVSWGSYSILVLLLGSLTSEISMFGIKMSMTVAVSNLLSWICAVAFAFVTNKLWVFRSRSWNRDVFLPELGKFLSARIVTGVLEIVLVPLLVGFGLNQIIFGIEGLLAKILVSVLVVILNYVFSKLFIFK